MHGGLGLREAPQRDVSAEIALKKAGTPAPKPATRSQAKAKKAAAGPSQVTVISAGGADTRAKLDVGPVERGLRHIVALYHLFIRFIPDSRTYSVPLCLKRQCDRTLGGDRRRAEGTDRRARRLRAATAGLA
jgi:hypothetical protein